MPGSDPQARALIDRYWDGLLESEPILGTAVGDERFDDRLPDPSDAGRAARETLHRSALEELAKLLLEKEVVERPQLQAILKVRSIDSIKEKKKSADTQENESCERKFEREQPKV